MQVLRYWYYFLFLCANEKNKTMETLVLILFILSILLTGIQLGFMQKKRIVGMWLVLSGLFIFAMHNSAIEQSYDTFMRQLHNTALVTDFVVVLVIEAILGVLLAILMIRKHYGEPVKKIFQHAVYLPGVIVFPALFYLMSIVYLNTTGFSFTGIAIVLALAFPLVLLGIRFLVKKLIPEFELRAELKFILHILQLLGGIILSIQYLKLPVNNQLSSPALPANNLLIIIFMILGIIGLGILKHRLMLRLQTISAQKRK